MIDRWRARLWARYGENPGRFLQLFFLFAALAGLAAGLAATAALFGHLRIPFVGNLGLFAALGLCGAACGGAIVLGLFRPLLRRTVEQGLARFDLAGSPSWGYALQPLRRLQLPEMAERILRLADEQALAVGEGARGRLVTAGKFGYWIPDEQLDKILDDEAFYALRGKTKDVSVLVLAVRGATAAWLDGDPVAVAALLHKQAARAAACAKAGGLLFSVCSTEVSLLVADIPYTAKGGKPERLLALAEKWQRETATAWAAAGLPVEAVAWLEYGTVTAGRLDAEAGGPYLVAGALVRGMLGRIRELPAGTCVGAAFAAKAGLATAGLQEPLPGCFQRPEPAS